MKQLYLIFIKRSTMADHLLPLAIHLGVLLTRWSTPLPPLPPQVAGGGPGLRAGGWLLLLRQ